MRRSRGIKNGWPLGCGGYVAAPIVIPTQDNTLAGDSIRSAGNPAWLARFMTLETRFSALGAA